MKSVEILFLLWMLFLMPHMVRQTSLFLLIWYPDLALSCSSGWAVSHVMFYHDIWASSIGCLQPEFDFHTERALAVTTDLSHAEIPTITNNFTHQIHFGGPFLRCSHNVSSASCDYLFCAMKTFLSLIDHQESALPVWLLLDRSCSSGHVHSLGLLCPLWSCSCSRLPMFWVIVGP